MKVFSKVIGSSSKIATVAMFFFVSLLCVSRPATAQLNTASIAGTVQDVSGAVIKGAQIKATETDTRVAHTATSGDDGAFTIPLLPVGSYALDVQFPGFQPYEQTGIVLTVGQVASVNLQLKPGSVSETVKVTANAQIVETQQSNSSTLVDNAQVEGLPLNGRNPAALVYLSGGINNPIENNGGGGFGQLVVQETCCTYPSEIAPSINGSRGNGVYFSLDGANNVDTYEMTGGPFPDPDATAEFNIVSGNYGAEYVAAPGGAVNIVTKSGTNQIHGDAFEFVRNGIFNARNFFAATPDVLKRNQFGGVLGAPIKRDKWFIFGSYQGTRLATDAPGNVGFVPTPAERGGDFSSLLPTVIKDPTTGLQFMGNSGTQPNVIPTARLDPVTLALLKYIPSRTAPLGTVVVPGTTSDKVIWTVPTFQVENQYVVKSDYIWRNHRIFGRYFYTGFTQPVSGIPPGGNFLALNTGRRDTWHNVTGGDTWTKGNLVSQFRFTYVRDLSETNAAESTVSLPSLGAAFTPGQNPTIQSLGVSGGFSVGAGNFNGFPRHTYVISEDVNWLRGRHEISFGGDVQRLDVLLETDNQQNGAASFSGLFTGNAFADYAIGSIQSFTQSDGIAIGANGTLPGFYGQDRIRATSRLTITTGLRWDPYRAFTSINGRIECWQPGLKSTVFTNAPVGITFPGDPGCNSSGTNSSLIRVQPRIGFAYQVDKAGKTAVRGGYGIYAGQFPMFSFLAFGTIQPFLRGITDTNPGPISNPWLGFPGGNPFAGGFELNLGTRPANTPFTEPATSDTFNPNFKQFYTQQWSLILERALAPNDVINVSYFGSRSVHLSQVNDDNQPIYVAGTAGAGCTVGQYGTTAVGQACSTHGNTQSRRPYPSLGPIVAYDSGADSFYHGLNLTYTHRFHAGFTLSSALTYSRNIDDTSAQGNLILRGPPNQIPDAADPHLRRGVGDFNQPYTWRTSGVWNLPFGQNFKGIDAILAKGWVWSGIFTRDAGQPELISTGAFDNSFSGTGLDFATLVPGVARRQPISDFTAASTGVSIINPAAFTINSPGTFGISGRNAFNSPDLTDFDTSIYKEFNLSERFRFQFRTEFFNALNHPQFFFGGPTTLGSGTFGKLTSARDPRIIQFSAKILF